MSAGKITNISSHLINYYFEAGRDYPWRKGKTPYRVYLSEVLLQRTKAEQVEPIFSQLVSQYYDVPLLYNNFREVSQVMHSLGLSKRLKYFKSGLKYLLTNHGGAIPFEREKLLAVPGVGDYIAATIRIFGYDLPEVMVDANVVRIFCRLYGLQFSGETRRKKGFIALAEKHVPDKYYVEYSYGLLDFAALICRPFRPDCDVCGLGHLCEYKKEQ